MSFSSVPVVNAAAEPAVIRGGDAAAKQAYQAGLAFEQVLIQQLGQELSQTVSAPSQTDGGSGDSSSDGSSDSTTGLLGGDPTNNVYSQLLPNALTSSVMSAGGTGIALQLAESIDPALRSKK